MRCTICDGSIPAGKARCPYCGKWNIGTSSAGVKNRVRLRDAPTDSVERLAVGAIGSIATNGGYPRRTVTLIGGEPGTGKSTMALQVSTCFSSCLYIASEESPAEIQARAVRLGQDPSQQRSSYAERLLDIDVVDCGAGTWIDAALEGSDHELVILDSLPGLVGLGNDVGAQECLKLLKRHVVEHRSCAIVIDHATKTDYFAGRLALQHEVDCTLVLVCESANDRLLVSVKNRHGPSGKEEKITLTDWGYIRKKEEAKRSAHRGKSRSR